MSKTTTPTIANLSWGQRLAIIEGNKVSDADASKVFGVSTAEIETARESVDVEENFDTKPFATLFSAKKPAKSKQTNATDGTTTSGTVVKKKPGNPGNKVKTAFHAVTTTPVPLEEFAKKHGVSINVLVQKKRFTTDKDNNVLPEFAGKEFKINKHDGVRSIWFEKTDN